LIRRIRNSLTLRILLITCSLLVAACLITYLFIFSSVPNIYSKALNDRLVYDSLDLAQKLKSFSAASCGKLLTQFSSMNNVSIMILDERGNVIRIPEYADPYQFQVSSLGMDHWETTMLLYTMVYPELSNNVFKDIKKAKVYMFKFADSEKDHQMLVIGDTRNRAADAFYRILPHLIYTIIIMSSLASWIYSRYITRPIIEISSTSKKMAQLKFDTPIVLNRKDEIGELAVSLNNLSRKLVKTLGELNEANVSLKEEIENRREQENKRRVFFSAVSHELKTPITVIKGQLEGMLGNVGVYSDHEKYLKRSLEVTCGMEQLVQELLTISHLESPGFTLKIEEFDFAEILNASLLAHDDLFVRKELTVGIQMNGDMHIQADRYLLKKVIDNLIKNAIEYSLEGSSVSVLARRTDTAVECTIDNTGAHIPEGALTNLFKEFYRVEQSRNRGTGGSGLGLHIVSTILELHKAEYSISNTETGVRFAFRINTPRAKVKQYRKH
jgi:signal transduction histidine kinase